MSLITRVKDILLKPKDTWPVIEGESATPASLYTQYLMILAAIPAICGFIGMTLIGIGGFGFSIKIPFLSGLVAMVVQYVMSLVMIYVFSLIIDALAPTFGGQKNSLNALKLSVYGATASMVGGIFTLIPTLAMIGVLFGLYSIYLIYLGLPVLMKNPQEKSVVYTIVILLVGIVIGMIMAAVTALVTPNPYKLGRAAGSDAVVSFETPGGKLKIDTARIDAATQQMEAAQKRMEAAQKSGDTAAMAKAGGDAAAAATGMLGGDPNLLPITTDTMKRFVPEQLGAFKRTTFRVQSSAAIGIAATTANADYQAGTQTMHVTVTDPGGMGSFLRMTGAMVSGEQESERSKEKTWQEGGRTMKHKIQKDGSYAELTVILKNGMMLEVKAQQMTIDALRAQVALLDINGMENVSRPKKS